MDKARRDYINRFGMIIRLTIAGNANPRFWRGNGWDMNPVNAKRYAMRDVGPTMIRIANVLRDPCIIRGRLDAINRDPHDCDRWLIFRFEGI